MDIFPAGTRPLETGPEAYFTGRVTIEPVVSTPAPARLRGARVRFEPDARTAWHTHPLGQTLVIISGAGLAQTEGGPVRALRPGDVVWFGPGEKHWHGAAPGSAMEHLAFQEAQDGVTADWLEAVSEADYGAAPEA